MIFYFFLSLNNKIRRSNFDTSTVIFFQGDRMTGKTQKSGKSQGILLFRESQVKDRDFEKNLAKVSEFL